MKDERAMEKYIKKILKFLDDNPPLNGEDLRRVMLTVTEAVSSREHEKRIRELQREHDKLVHEAKTRMKQMLAKANDKSVAEPEAAALRAKADELSKVLAKLQANRELGELNEVLTEGGKPS